MSDQTRFQGKTVVVTGGGTGIGRATCEMFLEQGACVAMIGRRPEPLAEVASLGGDRALAMVGDVSKSGEAARIVRTVVDHFGRLDVLVNNAATWLPQFIGDLSDDEIVSTLMVNQFGVMTMIRESLPHLIESRGNIVNLSSTGARYPLAANSLYAGTKAGVEQMTRSLAVELGPHGVRINVVAAGATDTDMINVFMDEKAVRATIAMTPLGRVGQPKDIARTVLFMASDERGLGDGADSAGVRRTVPLIRGQSRNFVMTSSANHVMRSR